MLPVRLAGPGSVPSFRPLPTPCPCPGSRRQGPGRLRIYAAARALFSPEEHQLLRDIATLLALALAVRRCTSEAEAAARQDAGEACRCGTGPWSPPATAS